MARMNASERMSQDWLLSGGCSRPSNGPTIKLNKARVAHSVGTIEMPSPNAPKSKRVFVKRVGYVKRITFK